MITVVNSTASTATAAKTAADNAQTTADNAQTTATSAKTTADRAQTTATAANTTANNALALAKEASSTYFHVNNGVDDIDKQPSAESLRTNEGPVSSYASAKGT